MNVSEHPVEFEVCERSGNLPWECGLAACENGCTTKTVEFVPLATHRGAVLRAAELEAEVARLRDGIEQKNQIIVSKVRRIWELEYPSVTGRQSVA